MFKSRNQVFSASYPLFTRDLRPDRNRFFPESLAGNSISLFFLQGVGMSWDFLEKEKSRDLRIDKRNEQLQDKFCIGLPKSLLNFIFLELFTGVGHWNFP